MPSRCLPRCFAIHESGRSGDELDHARRGVPTSRSPASELYGVGDQHGAFGHRFMPPDPSSRSSRCALSLSPEPRGAPSNTFVSSRECRRLPSTASWRTRPRSRGSSREPFGITCCSGGPSCVRGESPWPTTPWLASRVRYSRSLRNRRRCPQCTPAVRGYVARSRVSSDSRRAFHIRPTEENRTLPMVDDLGSDGMLWSPSLSCASGKGTHGSEVPNLADYRAGPAFSFGSPSVVSTCPERIFCGFSW